MQTQEAYGACVLELLETLSTADLQDFAANLKSLAPLLSQLILTESRGIRFCLSRIYADRVNALLP